MWWKITGATTITSHLAMLPFLWIMYYQFVQLAWRLLGSSNAIAWSAILFCLETSILAQSTMVSYDIILLCFYLFGLRYIIDRKPGPVVLATIILSMISIRGVFAIAALLISELLFISKADRKPSVLIKYLPAFAMLGAWSLWHYAQTGWMLFTPSDQWSAQRGIAGFGTMIHNIAAIVRVHLEPGRALMYLFIAAGLLEYIWKRKNPGLRNVLISVTVPLVIFSLAFVPFSNPIGHRYYMIVFAMSILLLVSISEGWSMRRPVLWLTAATLISGHFWIWPDNISKGWDSNLGHIPYFGAKAEMDVYLEDQGIGLSEIAAHFPLDVSKQQSHLSGTTERPEEYEDSDTLHLVLQSNINNDYSENDLRMLNETCLLKHEVRNKWVYVRLYDCSKPEFREVNNLGTQP